MSIKGVAKVGEHDWTKLTDREKQIYEMRKTKTTSEVAAELGLSVVTVRAAYLRAREKLS